MQMKDNRLRHKQQQSDESRRQNRVEDQVKLTCIKCGEFACYSDDLRCIKGAHHVVVDGSFTSRFETKPMKKPVPLNNGMTIQEVLVCKKCKLDWGNLAKFEGKELPLIHTKGFLFDNAMGKRKTMKKWKEVWFQIKDYDL